MQIRQIAVIALILAGAVACTSSGSDDPTSTPTSTAPTSTPAPTPPTPTTTSPSPTPTVATTGPNVRPGEKPPAYPAVSRTNTRSGALSFVVYWLTTLDWGYATTDSSLAKQNFLSSCTDCDRFMKNFDEAKAKGEHFRGGRVAYKQSTLINNDMTHPGTTVVDIDFAVARLTTVDRRGKTISTAPAIPDLTYRTWASWTGAKWIVAFEKQVRVK